jgi:hypothetical protein
MRELFPGFLLLYDLWNSKHNFSQIFTLNNFIYFYNETDFKHFFSQFDFCCHCVLKRKSHQYCLVFKSRRDE